MSIGLFIVRHPPGRVLRQIPNQKGLCVELERCRARHGGAVRFWLGLGRAALTRSSWHVLPHGEGGVEAVAAFERGNYILLKRLKDVRPSRQFLRCRVIWPPSWKGRAISLRCVLIIPGSHLRFPRFQIIWRSAGAFQMVRRPIHPIELSRSTRCRRTSIPGINLRSRVREVCRRIRRLRTIPILPDTSGFH